MEKTVAESVSSDFMDMYVLHNVIVMPTLVIMLAAVDNQRLNLRQHQQENHCQRQRVFRTINKGFIFFSPFVSYIIYASRFYQ